MSPALRPARPEDDLAPLLYESSPRSYDAYFGDAQRALRQLRRLVPRPGHQVAWDICVVAEDGGELVGVVAGFPAARYDSLARRATALTFAQSAPWLWPRMLRVNRQDAQLEPPAGSWYVDALAVAPSVRRRGIGRALLGDAERRAREAGCPTLSLDTAQGNVPARALYESIGMTAGEPVPGLERFGADGGAWVPYVKTL